MNYICLNGEILPSKHAKLSFDNRVFRFGEGIVEEMRSSGVRIPFFQEHFQRLVTALHILDIKYLAVFTKEDLLRSIELLLHRHKAYTVNKVKITLWREDDNRLLAEKDKVQYLIEVEPLEEKSFTLNEKGLIADIYADGYKSKSPLSPFKTSNNLFEMMALRYAKKHAVDACIIANAENRIIEEVSSNIFFANGKTIYTPALSSGCTNGIMRHKVIEIMEKQGYMIVETDPLAVSFIFEVEEIFLANDVYGISWIGGYKHKRYRRKRCVDLVHQLNLLFAE